MVELREKVSLSYKKDKAFLAYLNRNGCWDVLSITLILLSGKMTLQLRLKDSSYQLEMHTEIFVGKIIYLKSSLKYFS